jgi:hypothetical protein
MSTLILCGANSVRGTMSWDERREFVRGDRRQIQTAVLGGADSDEPLMLPLEAIELDAFRRRHEHDTFWCGLLLGGCGLQLTTKLYTDRVCSLSSSACWSVTATDDGSGGAPRWLSPFGGPAVH